MTRFPTYWQRAARRAVQIRSDIVIAALDMILSALAFVIALALRFDGHVPARFWSQFWRFLPVMLATVLVSNVALGLYGKLWRHASIHEARRLAASGVLVLVALTAAEQFGRRVPYSVIVTGTLAAVALMAMVRFQTRLFSFRRNDQQPGLRVLVIGSGGRAADTIRAMSNNHRSGLRPIAILDDDEATVGRNFNGLDIVGSIDDLADEAAKLGAHMAVVALSSPTSDQLSRAVVQAERARIPLKVMPAITETMQLGVSIGDLRDLQIEDLLGRHQVATDLDGVRAMLAGQTVLITGAGGSIGSEIARQVLECAPHRLLLLDHDETHLHDVAAELGGPIELLLADIRNRPQIDALFAVHRPTVVFHAAAHKHVPLLEAHPVEAASTNVLGTSNVVDAALAADVDRLVLISTDKAVRPSSIMGATKRLGEQLVLSRAPRHAAYCAVRFGNVLGSRGSVVPTFLKQIAAGGPVTVTDRRMTRYFMSIQEAVHLVLQAAALAGGGTGGDVFMLDMGEAVPIYELAERMIRLSGRIPGVDIEIRVTGVRPGEKLEEQLAGADELSSPTAHPSIRRITPTPVDADVLEQGVLMLEHHVRDLNDARCGQLLHRLAGEQSVTRP